MKRNKKWLTAGLALSIVGVLAGCATAGNTTSSKVNNLGTTNTLQLTSNSTNNVSQQTNSSTNITNSSQNQNSGQQGGTESVKYSKTQTSLIQKAAQLNGVTTPYVPTISLKGDIFQNAGGTNTSPNSIPKDGTFSVVFKNMVFNESNTPIIGGGVVIKKQNTILKSGISAQWIEVQGKIASPSWVLSFKDGNTYINMGTKGTKDQTLNIANSLVPLHALR